MFRCADSTWAVAAYPGYRDRLISAALNTLDSVEPRPQWLQRSESAAISAVATTASHGRKRMSSAVEAANSAIDAAEQKGGKKGLHEMLAALASEAAQLDQGFEPVTIANQQLWPMPKPLLPAWVGNGWEALKTRLLATHENWEVWISWYEDRLFGNAPDTILELTRATEVPDAAWRKGPKSANTFIRQQINGVHLETDNDSPPDPRDAVAFQQWLSAKPREWASVMGNREALRLFATLGASPGDTTLLAIFRAISASRYAVLHPKEIKLAADAAEFLSNRQTQMTITAYYAASAVGADDAASRATSIISDLGRGPNESARIAAVLRDALALVRGTSPQELARAPLWRPANEGGAPPAARQAWNNLSQVLLENGKHWQVWVDWYDYVLEGSPPSSRRNDAWETAFVGSPEPLPWDAGSQAVNTEISARIRTHSGSRDGSHQSTEVQLPQIPPQGYGPHFEIGENGVITFAPPQAIDRQGNNVARLEKLHPILRTLAREVVEALDHGNVPHRYLRDRVDAYRELVNQNIDSVDFARLYVEGVRLANAMRTTLADEELPRLAHPIHERLDSLLQLHGAFVLATAEGIEVIAAEERYRRTPGEEVEYRDAAVGFAESLQNEPNIIDPTAASFALGTAEEFARGANLERSAVVASGTIKNLAIVVSTAGVLGAASTAAVSSGSPAMIVGSAVSALVFGEGLKKSKAFTALASQITKRLDEAVDASALDALKGLGERFRPQLTFVLGIEPQLRRLASQHEELEWLNKTLDWISHRGTPRFDE